jgi:hypothetical protein
MLAVVGSLLFSAHAIPAQESTEMHMLSADQAVGANWELISQELATITRKHGLPMAAAVDAAAAMQDLTEDLAAGPVIGSELMTLSPQCKFAKKQLDNTRKEARSNKTDAKVLKKADVLCACRGQCKTGTMNSVNAAYTSFFSAKSIDWIAVNKELRQLVKRSGLDPLAAEEAAEAMYDRAEDKEVESIKTTLAADSAPACNEAKAEFRKAGLEAKSAGWIERIPARRKARCLCKGDWGCPKEETVLVHLYTVLYDTKMSDTEKIDDLKSMMTKDVDPHNVDEAMDKMDKNLKYGPSA